MFRSDGGGGITINGIDNRIYLHANPFATGVANALNRGFLNVSYRAADCADGVGSVLPFNANVGNRTLAAQVWSGSAYTANSVYPGCNGFFNNLYVIENTGNDIWTNNGVFDSFRFVYKGGSGSRTMTVKVEQLENTNSWARAGIMLREGLAGNARYVGLFVTPGNGLIFQGRTQTGGGNTTTGTIAGPKAPVWLRLFYDHASYATRAYYSSNGTSWTQIGSFFGASFFGYNMGLAASSKSNFPNTSVYSNLSLSPAL
jgi:hypothetical protein